MNNLLFKTIGLNLTQIKKTLLIRLDEIGDVIMTTPLLRELRRNLPDAWITLVVKPEVFNLVELCPYVDEVLTYSWKTPRYMTKLLRHLRAIRLAYRYLRPRRFDLAIVPRWDVDYYHASFLAYFSGARWRVAYSEDVTESKRIYNRGYDRLFTHLLKGGAGRHEVERNLDILRFLGGRVEKDTLEIWLGEGDERFAEEVLGERNTSNGLLVAFGPGAGAPKRLWPVERFIEVGRWLEEEYRARIVVVGGDGDKYLGERLRQGIGEGAVVDLTGATTLRQTGAILKRCHLYIGNDAGPMHIAVAAGIPVVEISCHPRDGSEGHYNSPNRFGPWKVSHAVLQPERAISPCSNGCSSQEPHCILGVSVEEVKEAIERLAGLHNIIIQEGEVER